MIWQQIIARSLFGTAVMEFHACYIVPILITSKLKNTKPFIIQQKLSQYLRWVHKVWCGHQQFSSEKAAFMFLIWRGKWLFDAITCKELEIEETNLHYAETYDILVYMEAETEELLAQVNINTTEEMEEQYLN